MESAAVSCSKSVAAAKVLLRKLRVKMILVTFFNKEGVVRREFLPERKPVNSYFSIRVMERLLRGLEF
jgi:hypothetical protein